VLGRPQLPGYHAHPISGWALQPTTWSTQASRCSRVPGLLDPARQRRCVCPVTAGIRCWPWSVIDRPVTRAGSVDRGVRRSPWSCGATAVLWPVPAATAGLASQWLLSCPWWRRVSYRSPRAHACLASEQRPPAYPGPTAAVGRAGACSTPRASPRPLHVAVEESSIYGGTLHIAAFIRSGPPGRLPVALAWSPLAPPHWSPKLVRPVTCMQGDGFFARPVTIFSTRDWSPPY